MAQGRSTKNISQIKWIRTSRLSTKNSLSNAGDGRPWRGRGAQVCSEFQAGRGGRCTNPPHIPLSPSPPLPNPRTLTQARAGLLPQLVRADDQRVDDTMVLHGTVDLGAAEAHIRQSEPNSGSGCQVKVLETFEVFPVLSEALRISALEPRGEQPWPKTLKVDVDLQALVLQVTVDLGAAEARKRQHTQSSAKVHNRFQPQGSGINRTCRARTQYPLFCPPPREAGIYGASASTPKQAPRPVRP